MEYKTQKILITNKISDEHKDYLIWQCHHANSLYNSVLYKIRCSHFEACPKRKYFDKDNLFRVGFIDRLVDVSYALLCKEFKTNKHYIAIGGQQGQQCIKSVVEGIKSYNRLIRMWWRGELNSKPKIPGYRTSGGMYQVAFTATNGARYDDVVGVCRLPLATENKHELLESEILIPSGVRFAAEQLSEVRIVPSNGELWAEYVYKTESKNAVGLNFNRAIGIDPGVGNWMTVVDSSGKSFIVCGRFVKSINQRYNKAVAQYKKGKSGKYWDEYLAKLTHKRNCQMRDSVNKAARFVINYCLNKGVGNIVFGWGQGVKNRLNLGKKTNQNFVQIPTARLKNRIKELAESVGIVFTETEEAYSSKSSFLDNDLVPKYGEKPPTYKFSGQRTRRGLYRSAKGFLINADCNGAASILRKVAIQLEISLAEVGKAALTLPKRYTLNMMKLVYRTKVETSLVLS